MSPSIFCALAAVGTDTEAPEIHTTAAAVPIKDLTISRIANFPSRRAPQIPVSGGVCQRNRSFAINQAAETGRFIRPKLGIGAGNML